MQLDVQSHWPCLLHSSLVIRIQKESHTAFLERVGDIDPTGVVYLSFGGVELSQDHGNWLLTVRPTLSSIGIYCTFLK